MCTSINQKGHLNVIDTSLITVLSVLNAAVVIVIFNRLYIPPTGGRVHFVSWSCKIRKID